MFSSRRNISKSEPQGRAQADGTEKRGDDCEAESQSRHGDMLARRRSSAPDEALLSGLARQFSHPPATHHRPEHNKSGDGDENTHDARKARARSSDMTDVGDERTTVAPANSPTVEPRP